MNSLIIKSYKSVISEIIKIFYLSITRNILDIRYKSKLHSLDIKLQRDIHSFMIYTVNLTKYLPSESKQRKISLKRHDF